MRVGDVMRRTVASVEPDAPIAEATRLMLENNISGLPVIDSRGSLLGIVTEGDFLRRVEIGSEWHRPRWLEFLMDPSG
jgi:CBS domain-containing protein